MALTNITKCIIIPITICVANVVGDLLIVKSLDFCVHFSILRLCRK